jgi:tetratricopeptide (TPR) repeat protein
MERSARALIERPEKAPPLALRLAHRILQKAAPRPDDTQVNWRERVASSRTFLNSFLDDPIEWVDLALAHTILGNKTAAERAIRVALLLAPHNRFVLRASARLYVHNEDLEHAQSILTRNPATVYDPWLLSAEIAIASARKTTSRLAVQGRRLSDNQSFRNYDRSELAMALATLEHESGGSRKRTKKLLRLALIDPTENTVAQADWLANRDSDLDHVNVSAFHIPANFEAAAIAAFGAGDWDTSYQQAQDWLADQPFSARPAILAGFIASSVLVDFRKAVRFCKDALTPNPDDATLLNNLAFSYANLDETKEARKHIRRAVTTPNLKIEELIILTATQGLISFREGDAENGEAFYEQAIGLASKDKANRRFVEMCTLYRIRERALIGSIEVQQAIPALEELADRTSSRVAHRVAELVVDDLRRRALAPRGAERRQV